jgi:hypothetical protein
LLGLRVLSKLRMPFICFSLYKAHHARDAVIGTLHNEAVPLIELDSVRNARKRGDGRQSRLQQARAPALSSNLGPHNKVAQVPVGINEADAHQPRGVGLQQHASKIPAHTPRTLGIDKLGSDQSSDRQVPFGIQRHNLHFDRAAEGCNCEGFNACSICTHRGRTSFSKKWTRI